MLFTSKKNTLFINLMESIFFVQSRSILAIMHWKTLYTKLGSENCRCQEQGSLVQERELYKKGDMFGMVKRFWIQETELMF